MVDCGFGNSDCGLFARRSRGASSFRIPGYPLGAAIRNRRGISLMEVLISMFVMLFGLMGVAAIFPVGNYYVVEGEKHDLGSLLAANAFEELQVRGMLRPERWLYAGTSVSVLTDRGTNEVIQPTDPNASPNARYPGLYNIRPGGLSGPGPGHAWVIDPMSSANAIAGTPHLDAWPQLFELNGTLSDPPENPWNSNSSSYVPGTVEIEGERWPVRRITLPQAGGIPLTSQVAEVIFRLRDDLAVEMPERDDVPSIQRWSTADLNNTPNDPNDDTLLSRQYQGNFSWLATVVPSTREALLGLQPASRGTYLYEVSVAVFYKRVPTPAAETERLINAEMIGTGELAIYATGANAIEIVDAAVEEIRPSNWIAVMGVNQTTGTFMLKWYRLLALDDETHTQNLFFAGTSQVRYAMLMGPDWPLGSYENLRVAILPGIASVVTREMVLEQDSMWNAN